VQKFEARKAQLQQRVTLIEQLRKGQAVPVHVLDEISKSLPDRLWLSELSQTGTELNVSGFTDQMTSVSDFIANLEATQWFKRPVEIVDSQMADSGRGGDVIRFQLKAQLQPPAPPAPAAAGARP
jgi:type IV pilus assembly protein PilN